MVCSVCVGCVGSGGVIIWCMRVLLRLLYCIVLLLYCMRLCLVLYCLLCQIRYCSVPCCLKLCVRGVLL